VECGLAVTLALRSVDPEPKLRQEIYAHHLNQRLHLAEVGTT
jgi:hypothetical protein